MRTVPGVLRKIRSIEPGNYAMLFITFNQLEGVTMKCFEEG